AVIEGTPIFPHEPIVRVCGSLIDCQLLETALLNCVNFETLIATKAARICEAAKGAPVAEFGLRRAQGLGGIWASRAAVVGGCASTSNVLAGKQFAIPVSGTHAHSWVMAFESEGEAFRAYAEYSANNCVLLVDTYNVIDGVKDAIEIGLAMQKKNQRLAAIRIDSGDLAWLSKQARTMLDEAGLVDCGIVLSNDLDECTIESLLAQNAPATAFGVGTKLATAYDQPALGGVYKMSALYDESSEKWQPKIKVTELASKITIPGVLNIRRFWDKEGFIVGDMVVDEANCAMQAGISDESDVMVSSQDELKRKDMGGFESKYMLEPLARDGKSVLSKENTDAMCARARVKENMIHLDDSHKRFLNPHIYPVGLRLSLFELRRDLIARLRGIK
ncbi:MAG: nicotinate phosphoribosyltransferase, partial [Eggerthellaceae bacterium]|nr:nicotinate phosphoribosyltransferase [Eggerthellaceae bacterium]